MPTVEDSILGQDTWMPNWLARPALNLLELVGGAKQAYDQGDLMGAASAAVAAPIKTITGDPNLSSLVTDQPIPQDIKDARELQIREAIDAAVNSGDESAELTAREQLESFEKAVQVPIWKPSGAATIGQGAFGLGDELEAAINALRADPAAFTKAITFQDVSGPGRLYDEQKAMIDAQRAQFSEQNPGQEGLSQLAGGSLFGGILAKTAPAISPSFSSLPLRSQGMRLAGIQGGLTGAGVGETPLERVGLGIAGAATGGLVGYGLGSIGDVMNKMLLRQAEKLSGIDSGKTRIAALLSGRENVADDLARLNQQTGGKAMIADITPAAQNEAGIVSQANPALYNKYSAALDARVAQGHADIQKAAIKAFGSKGNSAKLMTDMVANQKSIASPFYQAAHKEVLTVTPELQDVMTRQLSRGDYLRAVNLYNKQTNKADVLPIPKFEEIKEGAQIPLAIIDYMKRFTSSEGLANKNPAIAGGYKNVANELNTFLKANSDNYKAGAAAFSDDARIIDAAKAGRKMMKLTPEQIKDSFSGLASEAEKSAFMAGAVDNIDEIIKKISTSSDPSRALIGKAILKEKLGAILPAEKLDDLVGTASAYNLFTVTRNQAFRGSQTAMRESAKEFYRNNNRIGSFAKELASGNVGTAFKRLITTNTELDPKLAEQTAKYLFSQGPEAEATLRQIIAFMPRMSKKQMVFTDNLFSSVAAQKSATGTNELYQSYLSARKNIR